MRRQVISSVFDNSANGQEFWMVAGCICEELVFIIFVTTLNRSCSSCNMRIMSQRTIKIFRDMKLVQT